MIMSDDLSLADVDRRPLSAELPLDAYHHLLDDRRRFSRQSSSDRGTDWLFSDMARSGENASGHFCNKIFKIAMTD